jgi:alkanesulfonate monooxygenase SsuD/methylene tetrahydromethanopterin reductase-like flavin-dependent oxidoreductase (luciferase family)
VVEFGVQFFPVVAAHEKSAAQYWGECLALSGICDELGYTSIRTVEHYFHRYGGLSPSPLTFLAAAAMRSKQARLITGACLPIFNHPLQLASQIGLVDAISGGRLEVGLARAFLPLEFVRFGRSLDESLDRFEEGFALVKRLLSEENVSYEGKFHSFKDTTTLPRPTQRPHPPLWIAAVGTPASFAKAGRLGVGIMAIPMTGGKMRELLDTYRNAWREAGHPGHGRVMLAFHMYCAESETAARADSEDDLNYYLRSVVEAASDWTGGASTKDYPGYDKLIAEFAKETWESQVGKGVAWIGTPDKLRPMIKSYWDEVGGWEIASMQVNFGTMSCDKAERSMRLFSREVMARGFEDV